MPPSLLLDLRLALTPGIGPLTYWKLKRSSKPFKLPDTAPCEQQIQDLIKRHKDQSIHILTPTHPHFPKAFIPLPDCPPVLFVKGNLALLNHPLCVGIVGSRRASLVAKHWTQELSSLLVPQKICVVSGLALGIDGAAHQGALAESSFKATTVAMLAGGLDHIYPKEHIKLWHQILERQGTLVSEEPLGTPIRPTLFPKRNRLIAGLSQTVLVVEAAMRSGSLTTARLALEYGKTVLAVPGPPWDGRCAGSNKLLKEGAVWCESVQDVLGALNTSYSIKNKNLPMISPLEQSILDLLDTTPIALSTLMAHSPLPMDNLMVMLHTLESKKWVQQHPGSFWSRLVF